MQSEIWRWGLRPMLAFIGAMVCVAITTPALLLAAQWLREISFAAPPSTLDPRLVFFGGGMMIFVIGTAISAIPALCAVFLLRVLRFPRPLGEISFGASVAFISTVILDGHDSVTGEKLAIILPIGMMAGLAYWRLAGRPQPRSSARVQAKALLLPLVGRR